MSDHNTDPTRVDPDALPEQGEPFVHPDKAGQRPDSIAADAADDDGSDEAGVREQFTDRFGNTYEDGPLTGEEDGLDGDESAIFQRGVTNLPPG